MKKIFLLCLGSALLGNASASLSADVGSRFYGAIGGGVISNIAKNTPRYVNTGAVVVTPETDGGTTSDGFNIMSFLGLTGLTTYSTNYPNSVPGFSTASQNHGGAQFASQISLGYDFIFPCSGILLGAFLEGGYSNGKNRIPVGVEFASTVAQVDGAPETVGDCATPIYLRLSMKGAIAAGIRFGTTFGNCNRYLAFGKVGLVTRSISGKISLRQTWAGDRNANATAGTVIGASENNMDLIHTKASASGWAIGFRWGLGFEVKVTNAFSMGVEFLQDVMRKKDILLKKVANPMGYYMDLCSNKVSWVGNTFLFTAKYYFK